MIPDFTRVQLELLEISSRRPLVICDVDEVVVHFTRSFEAYLAERQLWLDTRSFALAGNIKALSDNRAVGNEEMALLIDNFFIEQTEHLPEIDGAVAALNTLAEKADVVFLTNLPHHARDKRITNLKRHGLDFPVITNSGPKGPALRHLVDRAGGPSVFIDDSPMFIQSARECVPELHLIHFMHDPRFGQHVEHFDFVSLRTDSWGEAGPHIHNLLRT